MKFRFFTFAFGLVMLFSMTPRAHAQERVISPFIGAGSGIEFGSGAKTSVIQQTPIFLDMGARTWSTERPQLVFGGSLRMEIQGRVSVGIVPRVEFARKVGFLSLSAGGGIPFFFAPFTMLGLEGIVTARMNFSDMDTFGIFASVFIDGFFWGSDIPAHSAVVMVNGVAGVKFVF